MPKCTIDGKEVEFSAGENLVNVAKRAGVDIPVFCYHPGLTVVAQCRMCYVEVEKMPKLQTACSTMAAEGMVVKTQSEAVKKGRAGTMEFLLLNHPLDCPICDKAGECDLQDNSFGHGSEYMRHNEERRTYVDVDMGPVIQKNMNRCIHCTRCIRFGDEIAGIHEMVAIQRGNNIDITTIDGKQLKTEYAGNYSDICPTGSLTLKDFRFKKRAWMLKKTATVCEGCSKGCNMEVQHEGNTVYRCVPRENLEINKFWMCDEGRFNYHYVQDPSRILTPMKKQDHSWVVSEWDSLLSELKSDLASKEVQILVGTDLSLEEMAAIKESAAVLAPHSKLFSFGTPGVESTAKDGPLDTILKMKSKSANLNGAEKTGIAPLQGPAKAEVVLLFRGGRAEMPKIDAQKSYGFGVFLEKDRNSLAAILPGLAFLEKEGTVINHQGKEQRYQRALLPRGKCKSIGEALMLLLNQKDSQKAKAGVS
jgi:NADH-quinone oxidoreductase subunit G